MTELADIPILSNRPRSVKWRYDRYRRRLHVSGSDFWLDIASIKSILSKHFKDKDIYLIIYGGSIILPLRFLK
jgi:hypothetical protein